MKYANEPDHRRAHLGLKGTAFGNGAKKSALFEIVPNISKQTREIQTQLCFPSMS